MRHFFTVFAGAVALAVCSAPAQATTILYDNLAVPTTPIGISAASTLAASFSTASTPITLTDVQFNFTAGVVIVDPSATISLLGDNGTSPGSLIASLGTINVLGGPAVFGLSGLSVPLAAGTRYWIQVVSSFSPTGTVIWSRAVNDSGTGVSSEYYSLNGGASVFPNSGDAPFVMEVSGLTAVPEPSALPFFVLGFLAMAFLGRRRLRFIC